MKSIKNILTILFSLFIFLISYSVKAENKTVEISLPTIQCDMCVSAIEKAVNKIDGVVSITVDVEGKKAKVTFDDTKTSLTRIEKAISKSGYKANNKKANKKAYDKLDDCCKIP